MDAAAHGVWYAMILAWARIIGLRIVWTLHNVLPHGRLFVDDIAARRRLLRACDLVIARSEASLQALEEQVGGAAARVRDPPRTRPQARHTALEPPPS